MKREYVFQSALLLTLFAYLALCGAIGVKALIYRRKGWVSGLLLSCMLVSLPFLVGLMYTLFLLFAGEQPE